MSNKKLGLIGGLILLSFAACQSDKTGNNDQNDQNEVNGLSHQDKEYMDKITYVNLGEIDAGNLAKQHGSNASIIDFGNMMVEDHGQAHKDLLNIATDKSYSLPSETNQEHKDMGAKLSALSGREFDSTFIYMMVKGHEKAIELEQDEIDKGKDEAVKGYASKTLPVIQHHRNFADSLAHALFP